MKHFALDGSIRYLPELLHGTERMDKRGTLYWLNRIKVLGESNEILRERYQVCLDEKRNFWAFMLSMISIATFPFSVMTGYFGMNFENMAGMIGCMRCVG